MDSYLLVTCTQVQPLSLSVLPTHAGMLFDVLQLMGGTSAMLGEKRSGRVP